jgi:hypothetical protein
MAECISITDDSKEQSGYMGIIAMYAMEYRSRQTHFIGRHRLWDAFIAEDDAGKR